jgi:hypothetical protein
VCRWLTPKSSCKAAALELCRGSERCAALSPSTIRSLHVGLEESDDGVWSLYLGPVLLGKIDEATMKVYG